MTGNRIPLVAIIGPGQCSPELENLAYEAGKLLAQRGYGMVCGGLGGVMGAACKGAFDADGITVGILPGSDAGEANPFVRIAIPSGIGQSRNAIVVRAAQAVLALGGGFGTLSEIALALRWGIPVYGVNTWIPTDPEGQQAPILECSSIKEAVSAIVELLTDRPMAGG
jgi:uncharacterized protein (TIGR00725 family)